MTGVVVDASVAFAWCFPDEASDYADAVLVALEGQTILVPAIWGLEIASAVLAGGRSKRLRQPEIRRFTTLLERLSPVQDVQPVCDCVNDVLPLAREYGLSANDAAYKAPPADFAGTTHGDMAGTCDEASRPACCSLAGASACSCP